MRKLLYICMMLLAHAANAQSFTKTQVCYNIEYGAAFDVAPDGRFFVTQKGGFNVIAERASVKVFDTNGNFLSVFFDLTDSVTAGAECGVLGITLDPDFTSNHYVYVYYIYIAEHDSINDDRIRIERFTEVNNIGTQPAVIFEYSLAGVGHSHVGGNIHFRPSDSTHLYVSVGDALTGALGNTPARLDNPFGKILRISKHTHAFPPADNPFYDDGNPYTGNCDWIWAYGLRNSYDFCFGPNDSLYATENGTGTFDEVNLITRGGFYGWPHCEGTVDGDTLTIPCHALNAIAPVAEFSSPLPALTGILFYTDTVWSEQHNQLIAGDYNHADLTTLYLSNAPAYTSVDSAVTWIDESNINGITDLRQGSDGCIYVLEFGDSIFGGIYKLCPVGTGIAELGAVSWMRAAPNPFVASTTLQYSLAQAARVRISLYDPQGRLVQILIDRTQTAGIHTAQVNAEQLSLSSGVYICRMETDGFTTALKLVVE